MTTAECAQIPLAGFPADPNHDGRYRESCSRYHSNRDEPVPTSHTAVLDFLVVRGKPTRYYCRRVRRTRTMRLVARFSSLKNGRETALKSRGRTEYAAIERTII